jgi:dynein heavy chain, axonemal
LDQRLSHLFTDAFSDCNKLDDVFKFLIATGSLLNRHAIMRNVEANFYRILSLFNEEMDSTKILIDKQMSSFQLHKNMPPISGLIKFCNEIRNKIRKPFELFDKLVSHPIIYTKEMRLAKQKYNQLCSILDDFQQNPLKEWLEKIDSNIRSNLEQNIIVRESENRSISRNFSMQVNNKCSYFM